MYSFNFDYIFNAVYNGFLAIRYAVLFWILQINPANYINDHKNDSYDGLIARGWIGDTTNKINPPLKDTVYLGSNSGGYSFWDYIKEHIFGIKINHTTSLSDSYSIGYGLNANDIGFATQKVNNDPWWSNLHFSIQNPILAFCADIVSVIAFFAMLAFIYSMFRWLFLTLTPIREKKEKLRQENLQKKYEDKEKRIIEFQEKRLNELEADRNLVFKSVDENINLFHEEVSYLPIKNNIQNNLIQDEKEEEDFPAGIKGLPIESNDFFNEEKKTETENNILYSYKPKNKIDDVQNKFINISTNNNLNVKENSNVKTDEISNLREERIYNLENPSDEQKYTQYNEKWNIIMNYMEGKEEALWRIGILEADNLLNDILSDKGYKGLTMADKLKNAYFNTIDLAWSAHKMRNRIAHDGSNFIFTDRMARNTLELYRSVFREFKILE